MRWASSGSKGMGASSLMAPPYTREGGQENTDLSSACSRPVVRSRLFGLARINKDKARGRTLMRRIVRGLLMAGIVGGLAAGAALAQPPADVAAKLVAIGRVVDPAGTAKLYAPLQKTMPQPGIKAERDIAYGADPKETLDVFTPEVKGKARPILIFVHGGGFVGGDKSKAGDGSPSPFYDNMMIWAVAHGMVGVNMNYRLAPQAQYPVVQHEIAEVVALARKKAKAWGGDPDRIVVWGHSAGASQGASFI